jgi:hypothetical protein
MPLARGRLEGLRIPALLALAALALHEFRYLAGHGEHAGKALAEQDHSYLGFLLPVVVSLCVALVVCLLLAAAFARPVGQDTGQAPLRRPFAYGLVLIAAFCAQEVVEGALSAAHPNGLDAVLGDRGWVVLPLAMLLGLLVSFAAEGLQVLEHRVAGALAPSQLVAPPVPCFAYRGRDVTPPARLALAFGFARRPPPPSPGR